jgi:hypothetical protein
MGNTAEPVPELERARSGAGALACEREIDAASDVPGTARFLDDPRPQSMLRRATSSCWREPCCLSVEPAAEAWP